MIPSARTWHGACSDNGAMVPMDAARQKWRMCPVASELRMRRRALRWPEVVLVSLILAAGVTAWMAVVLFSAGAAVTLAMSTPALAAGIVLVGTALVMAAAVRESVRRRADRIDAHS